MTLASHVHLDPLGGISGDMFAGCMLDAFPHLEEPLQSLLTGLAMPVKVHVGISHAIDHALRGTRFSVHPIDQALSPEHGSVGEHHSHPHHADNGTHTHSPLHAGGGAHSHAHQRRSVVSNQTYARHGHVPHCDIVKWLGEAHMAPPVRDHALGIFLVLAEAEAAVHGVPVSDVEFHEIGAWDSIVDIVAAAFLIDAVGATSWSASPLPIGGGSISTAHGVLPIPAPATAWLTKGMSMHDDGVQGERVTPTGAAILAHLKVRSSATRVPAGTFCMTSTGWGLGTRKLPDRSNALRCLAFSESKALETSADFAVNCIAFEVDDQSPEDLAVALDRLRSTPGVLQVTQIAAFGKKGRMAMKVEVVANVDATDAVVGHCFDETTTIGLRVTRAERHVLPRASVSPTGSGLVSVKVARRGGSVTAKAEMDEVMLAGAGHTGRQQVRRLSEAAALTIDPIAHGWK